jgi:hypothetical protein
MWLAGHCGKCGGEGNWIQDFWWRKVNERDRLEDEQIDSHERCKRADPSVIKPYPRQRLVFSFTLRPLYSPQGKTSVTESIICFNFNYVSGGS